MTGPTVGPLPVGSIEGWSWAPDFEGAAPRADGTPDVAAPIVTITAGPTGTTTATTASFSFTVDDPAATVECRLDTEAYATCSSPAERSELSLGDHTFTVRATDGAGNQESQSRTWTVEEAVTPPCEAPASGSGGSDDALDWLACELVASDGLFGVTFDGQFFTDAGLTMDALLSFALFERRDDPAVQASLDALDAEVAAYVTGFGEPSDRSAGATAKTLLTAILVGDGEDHFAPYDLEADLRALMQTAGPQTGRFVDKSSFGDFSNGFGQTLAVMALSHTDGGVPAPSIEFLLEQQCPAGGFRGIYAGTPGCDDDAEADTDYTALTIQALLTSRQVAGVDAAVNEAVAWLLEQQDTATGAFGGTGPTAGLNTNSSGLSAQALRAAGRGAPADEAADWVAAQQITTADAGTGPAGTDLGGIAYDSGAFADALTAGINEQSRDQWRRASIQGVLVFGAPTLGVLPDLPPPGQPTVTISATRVRPGDTITVGGAGFQPGEKVGVTLFSTPVRLATQTADSSGGVSYTFVVPELPPGAHRIELEGATSGTMASHALRGAGGAGDTWRSDESSESGRAQRPGAFQPSTSAGSGQLARTGTDVTDLVPLALVLAALGAALVATTRRRRLTTPTSP